MATTKINRTDLKSKQVVTLSQFVANQNNLAGLSTAQVASISSDSSMRAITGIVAPVSGEARDIRLENTGTVPVVLIPLHPGSSAGNRFAGETDMFIFPKKAVTISYNFTDSLWYVSGFSLADVQFQPKSAWYNMPVGSQTLADHGYTNWVVAGTGSAFGIVNGSSTLPTYYSLSTGTTATGSGYMTPHKSTIPGFYGSCHLYASARLLATTVSDGTDTYRMQFRLTGTPTTVADNHNNAVGIRYSHGINSGKWECFTRDNAGAESVLDSGVTFAVNTEYVLSVSFNKARTEACFYINGAMVGRITTNMPNAVAVGTQALMLKSLGITSRTMGVAGIQLGIIC